MLKVIGFDPGREDGFFDEKTEQAVKDFQVKGKMNATGILTGESTTRLMQSLRELVQNNDTQLQKAVEILKEEMAK
jgi:carboxyl-terminal processing protease